MFDIGLLEPSGALPPAPTSCVSVCVCPTLSGACRSQKNALDSLELE